MLDYFGLSSSRWREPAQGTRHVIHPGWPEATPTVRLRESEVFPAGAAVRLRPLCRRDGERWREQRLLDEAFLRPVEPTVPTSWQEAHSAQAWRNHLTHLRRAARGGIVVPLAIEVDGRFAGQFTVGNIQHGSICECWVGYWVFSGYTGAGVASAACALGVDHAFRRIGMHRVTATYLPDNPASGAVLAHAGFTKEGYLRRNLHIDGRWRDHCLVAIVRGDYPSTAVGRLRSAGRID